MDLPFFSSEMRIKFEEIIKKPYIKPDVSNSLIYMQSPFKFKHVVQFI